ncbi:MAG: hypothetical protein NDJ90_08740 [Oligoflexia bacterium]|nr:hypothetical protein [Oligoflexia bacterium]
MTEPESAVKAKAGRIPFYKRQYIVNPRFQWELTGFFIGISLVLTGAMVWWVKRFFRDFAVVCGTNRYQEYLVAGESNFLWMVTLAGVIAFVFATLGGILLSHRVAGPLYRFRRHMMKMKDAEFVGPIHFRKNDYFPELAQTFNEEIVENCLKRRDDKKS